MHTHTCILLTRHPDQWIAWNLGHSRQGSDVRGTSPWWSRSVTRRWVRQLTGWRGHKLGDQPTEQLEIISQLDPRGGKIAWNRWNHHPTDERQPKPTLCPQNRKSRGRISAVEGCSRRWAWLVVGRLEVVIICIYIYIYIWSSLLSIVIIKIIILYHFITIIIAIVIVIIIVIIIEFIVIDEYNLLLYVVVIIIFWKSF